MTIINKYNYHKIFLNDIFQENYLLRPQEGDIKNRKLSLSQIHLAISKLFCQNEKYLD